ncbi:MAG: bacteriocin immunity protein [Vagococcus sp.]|uniref:bacteriocin immunity protein n=1 Tax=Vagococcus sp. TaxID=1933889 RepID=UPI002FC6D87F
MEKLKWFSGGKDRSEQVVAIITDLLTDLNNDQKTMSLQLVLTNYKNELIKKESSIPLILSRMNLDISNTIKKNNILLSSCQSDKLKKIISMSHIRYGY